MGSDTIDAYKKMLANARKGAIPASNEDREGHRTERMLQNRDDIGADVYEGKKEGKPAEGMQFLYDLTVRVKEMQKVLADAVFGQDHAISTFVSGYFQSQVMALSDSKRVKPCAAFLFVGAPGVGKTFLAEKAAEVLALPFARFDMSEYSDSEAPIEFCGSDKVYKNGKAGNVTSFVEDHPQCVLLFDEIEKAHLNIIHLFLQMLDAGRLRDNYTDREVSFKDAIIILTTNAGRQLYENSRNRNLSGISRKTIIRALQSDMNPNTGGPMFPAAICSRFASGNVVLFNHMEAHNLKRIVKEKLKKSAANIEKSFGLQIEIDDDVSSAILFSEGGQADARTVTGRAENFLNTELFELFRLLASESSSYDLRKIKKVHFMVELPDDEPEIRDLFRISRRPSVLVFADKMTASGIKDHASCRVIAVKDASEAFHVLKNEDIEAVFIELSLQESAMSKKYLNIEDIPSRYIDFYHDVRSRNPSMPIFILETETAKLSAEERVSFLRTGARGICRADSHQISNVLAGVCESLHQQKSMDELARYSRMIEYGSGQKVSEDGTQAEIRLMDLTMKYAVDAADAAKILTDISRPNIRFEQVIGADDAKEELTFFADYLKHPRQYMKKGLRSPKGVLLYGPPGTGKTMLAKALATEADMTFITAEGGQFLKKYVGEGPEAVHDLFRTARKYAPSILFIDEIDAIGRQRNGEDITNSSSEILNALLTEMDGFRNENAENVFVLAATNFEVNGQGAHSLDGALVRRFDRKILVELPNREQRLQFLSMRAAGNPALSVSLQEMENIASRSMGMSLAALDSVIELSLRTALRMKADTVNDDMLADAFETFNSGKEKKWDSDKLLHTARHEAGHAYVCWKSGEVPSYLTIVARGDYGGYMQHENMEGKGIYSRKELLDRIRTALGGRAAEMVYYGREDGLTTGAAGDLEAATNMAKYMLCTCGMDEEVGMSVIETGNVPDGGTDSQIRRKINDILAQELEQAIELITEGQATVDRLVDVLMRENHIDGYEMREIFEKEGQGFAYKNEKGGMGDGTI